MPGLPHVITRSFLRSAADILAAGGFALLVLAGVEPQSCAARAFSDLGQGLAGLGCSAQHGLQCSRASAGNVAESLKLYGLSHCKAIQNPHGTVVVRFCVASYLGLLQAFVPRRSCRVCERSDEHTF